MFNALFLMVAVGAIAWEAVLRLAEPAPVTGTLVMLVAAAGVVVNGATALLFASGRKHDINTGGAYLHMAADAAVSFGVVAAGGLILATGWAWLDPATSLVIVAVIVASTWGLLKEGVAMSLDAVPAGIDAGEVGRFLAGRPGVARIHDLHIWPMSTTETALSARLAMPDGHPGDQFLIDVAVDLKNRFGIGHPTLQIEVSLRMCPLERHA